jgi:hypothetical protein
MVPDERAQDNELRDIIDQKLTLLVRELADANWSVDEVVVAIDAALEAKWLPQARALQAARNSGSENFVSDGNEG